MRLHRWLSVRLVRHKLCLGHDWSMFMGTFSSFDRFKERWSSSNPDNYCHIQRKLLPRLHEIGVTKEQTDKILVENPRRFFENR